MRGRGNFFRPEGPPVTLELPLPVSERSIVLVDKSLHSFQSDSQVRELAQMLRLHQTFVPAPSVEMLLAEFAEVGLRMHMLAPMKGPAVSPFRSMNPVNDGSWELCTDNPLWGDNAEASSSRLNIFSIERAADISRLTRVVVHNANVVQGREGALVLYDENFAVRQIMENLHPGFCVHTDLDVFDTEMGSDTGMLNC